MTGRWWTRTAAAKRLGKTLDEVEALIASGDLHLESIAGDHEVISQASVEQYEREHPRPAFTPWTRDDDPEAFHDRADYTPNDEGEQLQ
ncbi:hypothetical protein E1286_04925 [Nonomuraea terrae]|uniref:DNA-binding protein n=1 Tax=Nonomuraea terrae TaxID=2530383 RepID=A0A4R4Z988_9ACTN|nr:hypothetical protein [Nonomuraea terrae]TDD54536.1 hypothetical protein E1286_04925 [Nonomuraea terrae]